MPVVTTTTHPNEANAPPDGALRLRSDTGGLRHVMSQQRLEEWHRIGQAISDASTAITIGRFQEPEDAVFGRIGDAKVNEVNQLAVLDAQAQEVRVFGTDGRYLRRFGGIGDGPTELRYAKSVVWLGADSIVVPHRNKVKVFAIVENAWGMVAQHTVPTTESASGACAGSGAEVFTAVWGRDGNSILQRLDRALDDVESIGDGYQDNEWLIQHQLSQGLVGCLPEGVVFGFRYLPSIRMYASGELLWESFVEDHVPVEHIAGVHPKHGTPSITMSLSGVYDILVVVSGTPSGHVIAQYSRGYPDGRPNSLRTYLIDGQTGAGALLSDQLPRILSTYREGYVVLLSGPYPRVATLRMEWRKSDGRGNE